ncbi:MAG: sigma-70 family RNA polymerase sigma factor [Clostridia bacterium]|nr:sigma-70 family RNA polymerase sigma factor [Clostridia bacterium]
MAQENRNQILLARIAQGDETALDELVLENMGLVKSIVVRFHDRGVEYEDLVQIGTIGMIKAARSFDFTYGNAFSTYAVPLITGEILRFLRDDGPIKVSRSIKAKASVVMRERESFLRANSREPRLSELAEACGMSSEEVSEVIEASSPIFSLSDQVGNDPDGMRLSDVIPDNSNEIEKLTDIMALRTAINNLDEVQRKIVHLRFYKNLSQQMTGRVLGLTQVKVSREEKKIIKLLKDAL